MQQIILSIPQPCHEDWQQMTPTQQGRYCNACAKQVIDFSAMSDAEVLQYFSNLQSENVCGRTYPDQLERTIAMPVYPKKKLFWYWNYITMFFLFFAKSNSTKAQGGIKMVEISQPKKAPQKIKKQVLIDKYVITGTIRNDAGEIIPFASISILNSAAGTSADENGKFTIATDQLHTVFNISALGYEAKQFVMDHFGEQDIVLKKSEKKLEKVVVVSSSLGRIVRCTAGAVSVRVTRRNILSDTIKTFVSYLNQDIKIYPNPVSKGNSFSLALKLKKTGTCKIQITDAMGRIVLIKQINATAKLYTEQVATNPAWSSGIYYLNVSNQKNSLISTGSFSLK